MQTPEFTHTENVFERKTSIESPHVPAPPSVQFTTAPAAEKNDGNYGSEYPFDWSLCTKVRIIGKSPFSWCAPLKSKEETGGIMKYLRENTNAQHDLVRIF